jgi:uncharacterized protein YjbI with pentapeptide repeats
LVAATLLVGLPAAPVRASDDDLSRKLIDSCVGCRLPKDLHGRDLHGLNFVGTDLRDADLSHSNLSGAQFTGANLEGARAPICATSTCAASTCVPRASARATSTAPAGRAAS